MARSCPSADYLVEAMPDFSQTSDVRKAINGLRSLADHLERMERVFQKRDLVFPVDVYRVHREAVFRPEPSLKFDEPSSRERLESGQATTWVVQLNPGDMSGAYVAQLLSEKYADKWNGAPGSTEANAPEADS